MKTSCLMLRKKKKSLMRPTMKKRQRARTRTSEGEEGVQQFPEPERAALVVVTVGAASQTSLIPADASKSSVSPAVDFQIQGQERSQLQRHEGRVGVRRDHQEVVSSSGFARGCFCQRSSSVRQEKPRVCVFLSRLQPRGALRQLGVLRLAPLRLRLAPCPTKVVDPSRPSCLPGCCPTFSSAPQ